MANSVSHASLPYPIKNARFTVFVPFLDADGDPTDPTTPDTEVSQDGAGYADAAEEVSTITGSNGSGYITLSGAETNNSLVGLAFKVASGPKATLMALYPRNLPILASGTASAGAAGSLTLASSITYDITGCFVRTTGGTGGGGTGGANNQARRITAYNTSTQVATVTPNWETTPDGTTTYDVLLPEGVTAQMVKTLVPTTSGRTLDVSSGGEAGIDWANVGTPGSTVGLSATTVGTITTYTGNTVQTGDSFARIGLNGAGLTDINLPDQTMNITGNITGNLSGSVGSVTGAVGSVTGSVGSIAAGGIAAASFAAGAIDAAAIAANAIGASELAADAVAEIADAVWDEAIAGHVGAGSTGEALNGATAPTAAAVADAVWDEATAGHVGAGSAGKALVDALADTNELQTDWVNGGRLDLILDNVLADTDDIQTRIPAALVGGRIDANIGAVSADATAADNLEASLETMVTGTATGTPTTTTMADSALTEATNDHYNGRIIIWRTGALAGQATNITDYDGATKTFTFTAVTEAASAGDAYVIV